MFFSKKSAAALLATGVMVASSAIASTTTLFQQNGLLSMVLGDNEETPSDPNSDPAPLPVPEIVPDPVILPGETVQAESTPAPALLQPGNPSHGAPIHPWKVIITSDGFLAGRVTAITDNYSRVVAASKATVTARQRQGVAGTAQVGPGGVFQMANLNKGRYGFVIDGREGLAIFGKYVTDHTEAEEGVVTPLSTVLCANEDRQMILDLMASTPQGSYWQGGSVIAQEEIGQSLEQGGGFILDNNGRIQGRIVIPHDNVVRAADGMDIWFIQHGKSIGTGRTDSDGLFTVDGLTEGYYSMVAVGSHGFAAVGVQVTSSSLDPVTALGQGSSELSATTVVTVNISPVPQADLQGQSIGGGAGGPGGAGAQFGGAMGIGGGGGGFGGGGGGAGGGGGGLGALLGGAAGAAIGYAVGNNNNNTVISPPGP